MGQRCLTNGVWDRDEGPGHSALCCCTMEVSSRTPVHLLALFHMATVKMPTMYEENTERATCDRNGPNTPQGHRARLGVSWERLAGHSADWLLPPHGLLQSVAWHTRGHGRKCQLAEGHSLSLA